MKVFCFVVQLWHDWSPFFICLLYADYMLCLVGLVVHFC